jgi:hypothetical protein
MTATAPQAAVSWSSVAKNVGAPSLPSPRVRGMVGTGQAVFRFCVLLPNPPTLAGEVGRGRRAIWWMCVSTDGARGS